MSALVSGGAMTGNCALARGAVARRSASAMLEVLVTRTSSACVVSDIITSVKFLVASAFGNGRERISRTLRVIKETQYMRISLWFGRRLGAVRCPDC